MYICIYIIYNIYNIYRYTFIYTCIYIYIYIYHLSMKKQKFKTKNWYMLNSLKILASWVKYALNLLFFNQY